METAEAEGGLTRQSRRERVKTTKALEYGSYESGIEDTVHVTAVAPSAPRTKRIGKKPRPEDQFMPTRNRATAEKRAEQLEITTTTANQPTTEKTNTTTNLQIKVLTNLIMSLLGALEEQKEAQANQVKVITEMFTEQIDALRAEVTEKMEVIQTQLSNIQAPLSAAPSYADVARTPPSSQPSNLTSFPSRNTMPSTITDTLYCTVDTSRVEEENMNEAQPGVIRQAIENGMRTTEGHESWRRAAVIKDPRNPARIRITCRNKTELQRVKEAAQKTLAPSVRVLRDQLYPVKVDNANRTAVLNQEGKIWDEAAEVLGKENNVCIAQIGWLSKKDTGKAYGSMVVYVTKSSEAARLLQDQYFHIAGESAYVRTYEPKSGPTQCYRCQTLGHKAFACTGPQICAKCAQEGHHHNDCQGQIPKCIPCGGPHESFSKNCRVLYPTRYV